MKHLAFALVALSLSFGCSRSGSEGAGAGPDTSAGTSVAQPPAVGGEVKAPTSPELPALAVGQWSKYRISMDDGQVTEVTYKVVGEENGSKWLEIVRGAANAGTVIQLLIEIANRSDPESLKIHAARIRMPNGHVRELRGEHLGPTADGYKKALADIFVPSLVGAPREDVTVPAGTFRQCYKRTQKVETSQAASEQTVWLHTNVPISGVVKSEEVGKPNKTELLTWGTSGAQSELNQKNKSE